MFDFDRELAERYGVFTSYQHTHAYPAHIEYYGENPAAEVDRLLAQYATTESTILDIGCGAGQTLCQLAPRVKQIWGIDQNKELFSAAQQRVQHLGITNATLIYGSVTDPEATRQLPDASFDLAFSRRGPSLSEHLLRTLRPEAIFVQEVVSNLDGYPLGEIFGRRHDAPYTSTDQAVLLSKYADYGLVSISCKEYFYEEFFRDSAHLEAFLTQVSVMLTPWLLPQSQPRKAYDPQHDRPALDLYIRYNTTPQGIRVLRQRKIFVLRQREVPHFTFASH